MYKVWVVNLSNEFVAYSATLDKDYAELSAEELWNRWGITTHVTKHDNSNEKIPTLEILESLAIRSYEV